MSMLNVNILFLLNFPSQWEEEPRPQGNYSKQDNGGRVGPKWTWYYYPQILFEECEDQEKKEKKK